MAAPINLNEFKAKIRDDKGIPVEADGKTFFILPPELLTDEQRREAGPLLGSSDPADEEKLARILCDDYDGFVAAGGSAVLLALMLGERMAQQVAGQGVTEGEGSAS